MGQDASKPGSDAGPSPRRVLRALRFYRNADGTFRTGRTPRAWLAWEDASAIPVDPLPRWKRFCQLEERGQLLLGATGALLHDELVLTPQFDPPKGPCFNGLSEAV